jgi:hypothetical protein
LAIVAGNGIDEDRVQRGGRTSTEEELRGKRLSDSIRAAPSLFHEPWWLDAAAPGAWREARVEEAGRPIARLPYAEQRAFGLRFLLAPPLSARLGPMADLGDLRYETRLRRFDHLVDSLIDQLPAADLFRQVLHPDVALSWLPFYRRGFRVQPQISYVIDSPADLDVVWNGIAKNTRRKIRAAAKNLRVERDDTTERLQQMVHATFRRQQLALPVNSEVVRRVCSAALERGRGTILTAVDSSDAVHASVFCAWDESRAWYLLGGGEPQLRSSQAGTLLLWEMIKASAGRVDRFDFEGSMLPNVEDHFRQFGGRQETCFLVTKTSKRFSPVWAALRKDKAAARETHNRRKWQPERLLQQMAGRVRRAS